MIEKIGNCTYDTENAKELGSYIEGNYGETTGYEETLYQNNRRLYFFHGIGGSESKYPTESIIPVKAEDAKEWLKLHS